MSLRIFLNAVVAMVLLLSSNAQKLTVPKPKRRANDPETKKAFEKMHELYCRKRPEKSVCQLYFARKSGESRPALPDSPPTKDELDEMHEQFCSIKEYQHSFPCKKWRDRRRQHGQ